MKRCQICLCLGLLCLILFAGAAPVEAQDEINQKYDPETMFWESVRDSNDIEMYRAYLEKYPNGNFAVLAEIKIKALSKNKSSKTTAPPPKSVSKAPETPAPSTHIKLRAKPEKLFESDLKAMIIKHNFSFPNYNPDGNFKNEFVDNRDGTITDDATGLIWQMGHSPKKLKHLRARKYIENLN